VTEPPILVVADLDNPNPHPFAVLAVYPDRPAQGGGCYATCVSLHMTREEAECVVRSSGSYSEACQ